MDWHAKESRYCFETEAGTVVIVRKPDIEFWKLIATGEVPINVWRRQQSNIGRYRCSV